MQPISKSVIQEAIKSLPASQRPISRFVLMNEGIQGLSHTKFVQDTLSVWVPKALFARSLAELSEQSLLEFAESFIVYYALGLSGQKIFFPLAAKAAKLASSGEKALLTQSLESLTQQGAHKLSAAQLGKVLPAKAGMIIATLGLVTLAGEYALMFAKNLMTARAFGKEHFTQVANLEKAAHSGQSGFNKPISASQLPSNQAPENQTSQKAQRRIKQIMGLSAGVIASGLLLARFGGKSKALVSASKQIVKHFDFRYGGGDIGKLQFGLGRKQLMLYMGIAVAGYLDSARDNFERKETATRLGVVLPYLLFGQEFLQKKFNNKAFQKYPQLFHFEQTNALTNNLTLKTLEELSTTYAPKLADAASKAEFEKLVKVKNRLFIAPLLLGVTVTGLGLSYLNRTFTKKRFERETQKQESQKQYNQKTTPPTQPTITTNPFQQTPLLKKPFTQFGSPTVA